MRYGRGKKAIFSIICKRKRCLQVVHYRRYFLRIFQDISMICFSE